MPERAARMLRSAPLAKRSTSSPSAISLSERSTARASSGGWALAVLGSLPERWSVMGAPRALRAPQESKTRHSLQPQPEGLEADGGRHLKGHQRVAEQRQRQLGIGQRPPLAGENGIEDRRTGLAFLDGDQHVLIRRTDAEAVAAIHRQEGRDVERLAAFLLLEFAGA